MKLLLFLFSLSVAMVTHAQKHRSHKIGEIYGIEPLTFSCAYCSKEYTPPEATRWAFYDFDSGEYDFEKLELNWNDSDTSCLSYGDKNHSVYDRSYRIGEPDTVFECGEPEKLLLVTKSFGEWEVKDIFQITTRRVIHNVPTKRVYKWYGDKNEGVYQWGESGDYKDSVRVARGGCPVGGIYIGFSSKYKGESLIKIYRTAVSEDLLKEYYKPSSDKTKKLGERYQLKPDDIIATPRIWRHMRGLVMCG